MEISQNRKIFANSFVLFFLHFLNSNSIFKIFKKKMTLIADVFLKLRTPKSVVR